MYEFKNNFSTLSDVQLIELSRRSPHAKSELLVRYFPWTSRLITFQGRSKGLQHQEIDDACQDAVFAIEKAIKRFDTTQLSRPGACSFRTFLRHVVVTRFIDFLRRRKRYENHIQTFSQTTDKNSRIETDPAMLWQSREIEHRVKRFINDLEQPERRLMNELRKGTGLQAAAESAGISYDKAKRVRRKLKPQMLGLFE